MFSPVLLEPTPGIKASVSCPRRRLVHRSSHRVIRKEAKQQILGIVRTSWYCVSFILRPQNGPLTTVARVIRRLDYTTTNCPYCCFLASFTNSLNLFSIIILPSSVFHT